MKPRLLIFDWDGTLMNSISHIVASLQFAMVQMGIAPLDDFTTRDVIGLGMREAIIALFPENADGKFIEHFTSLYKQHYLDPKHNTQLFPGVAETLDDLRADGYSLAIATSKGRSGLEAILDKLDVQQWFVASSCADETRSKPHPDMLFAILAKLGIQSSEAIMIGDTEYDLQMASNADMASIGVSYGVHSVERLNRHKPLSCLQNIIELPGFLASLNYPKVLSLS